MENQILSEITEELKSRVKIIDAPKQFKIEEIFNGVVLIHAQWSGPSVSYLKTVLQILSSSIRIDFDIIILDIDKLSTEEQKAYLGFFSHGYLEGVLIENSEIVSRNEYGKGIESFNSFKSKLVEFAQTKANF